MSKKISIIVPVYNVELYLERCVKSIVSQNVPNSDYELICVNDGSTDSSRAILSDLKQLYPFIQVVDKQNGGLSSARNAGLEIATGEFIFFIDSDDWIANGSLALLCYTIDKNPIDILLFSACEIDDFGRTQMLNSSLAPNATVWAVEDYLNAYTLRSSAWQGIFARRLFVEHSLSMKLGFLAEDDDFIVRIFSVAQKVGFIDTLVYYYYQRSGSISKSVNKEHQVKLVYDKLQIIEDLKLYVNRFDGKLRSGLERKLDFLAVDLVRFLIRQQHSSDCIKDVLQRLTFAGYYPFHRVSYSLKYQVFALLLSSPRMVCLISRMSIFKSLF